MGYNETLLFERLFMPNGLKFSFAYGTLATIWTMFVYNDIKQDRLKRRYEDKINYMIDIFNREGVQVDEFDIIALKALGIRVEIQEEDAE
jgi:hypothetical protein